MVKTPDFWELDHRAIVHSLYSTGLRGILVQSQMCLGLMIVAQEAADYVSEMGLAEHDNMVEAISP